ncbi:MAG TPA: BrnA antitoxin family protein [Longimicrobium sp.]|nr:BrnA antitoxin family protein [Longimicrobium sp.]
MKDEYDLRKGVRGPVFRPQPGTTRITLRLDEEILDWFRRRVHEAGGGNYQRLINHALHDHISRNGQTLEELLRRIVSEEVSRAR